MHLAIVTDHDRLLREEAMFRRLYVALLDIGHKTTWIIPSRSDRDLKQGSPGILSDERAGQHLTVVEQIRAPFGVPFWSQRARTEQIAAALERNVPDIVYAMGNKAWHIGLQLSKRLERPLACEVWNAPQVARIRKARWSDAAIIVRSSALKTVLSKRLDPSRIHVVPIGVQAPPTPIPVRNGKADITGIGVVGSNRDIAAYRALLVGLSKVVREYGNVLVFLELRGRRQHEIWREVQRLDLVSRVSSITDAFAHRTLLARCDVLVLPERLGEVQSILFEAMACGVPIIAGDDAYLDMLKKDETAIIVNATDSKAWANSFQTAIAQPQKLRAIGVAGRKYVLQNHLSSHQAGALAKAFEDIVGGESLSMSQDDDQ